MPRWFGAALTLGLLLAAAPPGRVATAQGQGQVTVTAGYHGLYTPGRAIPVRVSIRSERFIRADLLLTSDESPVEVRLPVEVPGGSAKAFVLTMPTTLGPPRVNVLARFGDARGSATASARFDEEVVGVLPSVHRGAALPGSSTLAVDAGTARFVALGDAELGAAPASFGPLTVMIAGRGEIAALDTATRGAVLTWIEHGGRLLVGVDGGEHVPGLPDEWQPGSDGRAAAGLGEVIAAGDAIEAARWDRLVEPTPLTMNTRPVNVPPEEIQQSLARDAGVRVPELDWLLLYLGAYVVVCVPLTLILLRRRGRGELGWIVVPGLAIAFTIAAAVIGRDLREVGTAAHATIVRVGPTGADAHTVVGLVSSGNDVTVGWPDRWSVGQPNFMFGPPGQLRVATGGRAIAATSSSSTGQFNVQSGRGLVDVGGDVVVTASAADDGRVTGVVRNELAFDLDDAAVFFDAGAERIGYIGSGEEVEFEVQNDPQADPFNDQAQRIWPNARPFGPGGGLPDLGMWAAASQDLSSGAFAPGTVVVAGWTKAFRPAIDVGGRELTGSTLVVRTATVGAVEGGSLETAVRSDKMRSPLRPDGGFDPNAASLVLRFVLPDRDGDPAPAADALAIRAPRSGISLAVWRQDRWEHFGGDDDATAAERPGGAGAPPVEVPDRAGPFGPWADFRLPDGSARDGVVWVRATVSQQNADPFLLTMATFARLREAT